VGWTGLQPCQRTTIVAGTVGAAIAAAAVTVGGVSSAAPVLATGGWNCITSGTISKATMLMILIKGLTAGPAVSL